MAKFHTRIKNKHETEAHWNSATNFTPLDGEIIVYDVDSNHPYPRYKVGDGTTLVDNLPFSTDVLDDYLKQVEPNTYQRLGNVAYNVCNCCYSTNTKEIVIYTGIRFLSSRYMPVIHIYGYAYGLQSPIELKIGFYIFADKLGYCGVTNMGAWAPDVYLFKYTKDEIEYVAVGLKGIIYFPQFGVDVQSEMDKFNQIIAEGWYIDVVERDSEDPLLIPDPDDGTTCIKVPYKPIPGYVTDSSLSTSLSNYVTTNTYQNITGGKTFNTEFSGSLPVIISSNDTTQQLGFSSTAIWKKPVDSSTWYSVGLQDKNGTIAYLDDIPNTDNFITNTQLSTAIQGVSIDDGTL